MASGKIVIPNYTPSRLNQYQGYHWSVMAKAKKLDRQMIAAYSNHIPKATGKRRLSLTIIFGKGQRSGDPDAYFKGVCDGLKHAGMLIDDSYKYVELMPVKYERGEKTTIIELEDILALAR